MMGTDMLRRRHIVGARGRRPLPTVWRGCTTVLWAVAGTYWHAPPTRGFRHGSGGRAGISGGIVGILLDIAFGQVAAPDTCRGVPDAQVYADFHFLLREILL